MPPIVAAAAGVKGGGKALAAGAAVADLVGQIGDAVKGFGEQVLKAVNPMQQLGDMMARFVGLTSPADLNLFINAVQDLNASIGQLLLPVFRLVTESVRQAADVMHSLAPIGRTLAAVLEPLFDLISQDVQILDRVLHHLGEAFEQAAPALLAVGEAALEMLEAFRPLVELAADAMGQQWKALAAVITEVAPLVVALTRVLADFVREVNKAVRDLLSFVGIDIPGGPERVAKKGEAVGAAVRPASFGSVEDTLKKTMASAYSLGTGADPAKEAVKEAKEIKSIADKIYDRLREIPADIEKFIVKLPEDIAAQFMKWAGDIIAVLNRIKPPDVPKEAMPVAAAAKDAFVGGPRGVVKAGVDLLRGKDGKLPWDF
jgi:hypothetical protein